MKRSVGVVLAALAAVVVGGAAAPASAIVAGAPARLADHPSFTVVGAGCGGALIAPKRVLTAAHCRETVDARPTVRVGSARVKRKVVLRAIHPLHMRELAKMEREFPPPAADLMVLGLDRPVRGVPLARIATPADRLTAPGTRVLAVGRGATASDGSGQGRFRSGTVAIEAAGACADQLPTRRLRVWSLCTRDPRMADRSFPGPFVSACLGDSGSPLLAGPEGARLIVGVVSWGPQCGETRDPEIYANAVAGRAFALARRPAWAPAAIGRPRIAGRTVVGATVRCAIRWRAAPTRALRFSFVVAGREVQSTRRNRFRLLPDHAGKPLACDVSGATAGGRFGSPLSRERRVRAG